MLSRRSFGTRREIQHRRHRHRGRDGHARTQEGNFEVGLSTPKELGGAGGAAANLEQLFAAGYAACFIGALKVAGQQLKMKVPADTAVTATVGIGPAPRAASASPRTSPHPR